MDQKNMKLIGSGSGSEIYLYSTKGSNFVLKFVPSTNVDQIRHLNNEANMLSTLDSDYIIKSLKYHVKLSLNGKKQNSQLRNGNILVMEYAPKGSLLDYFKTTTLTLPEVKTLFRKVCVGLKHMHFKGLSHRDLKLENILMFEENQIVYPKISDLGFAVQCFKDGESVRFKRYIGTQKGYMAPQIHRILTEKQFDYDAMKTDIFSLGVILFALVLGRLPFEYSTKENKLYKLIRDQNYDDFWKRHQSQIEKLQLGQNDNSFEKFKDLFVRMVHYDPEQRPNISEIMQSSWLSN